MHYLKISTQNGEIRWMNLDRVTRATRSFDADSGEPILVLMFGDGDRVTIHGTSAEDAASIDAITDALDECVDRPRMAA